MSLANARKKYKSTCLAGSGPKFAVVGTKKADSITAAKNAERILGLGGNDKITTKSGNSYANGGNGAAWLNGGKGKDTASVVAREMKYAHRHGCETVRRIRAKA